MLGALMAGYVDAAPESEMEDKTRRSEEPQSPENPAVARL